MKIIFALGSNLGNRKQNLEMAINLLEENLALQNLKQSQILVNKALLKPNSPQEWNKEFYNMAISAIIDLQKFPAEKILEIIHKIENEIGRKRSKAIHKNWAPREIDIDILAIENLVIDSPNLTIPHQHLHERGFFLIPLAEIENEWKYPKVGRLFGLSAKEIYENYQGINW